MMKYLKKLQVLFCVFIFISVFSCKTVYIKELVPFNAIGNGADVYVFLPTAGNEKILELLLGKRLERQDIKIAISRTKTLHIGLFTKVNSPRKTEETLLCAVGSYPANMAGSIFKEKNGWIKYTAKNNVNYYSGGISAVSVPNNQNAFLALSNTPETSMQFLLDNSTSTEVVSFSQKYNLLVENPIAGTVSIFVKSPNFFIEKLLGVDLQLPVKTSEIYLTKNKQDLSYSYDFSIETGNKMTAFALSLLLKKAMNANVKTENFTIFIENGTISEQQLALFFKQLL